MPGNGNDKPKRNADTSSGWWQQQAAKEKERRRRLEILADSLGARAEQVQEILAKDSAAFGETLATARETREAIADLRGDVEAMEETITALRIHCSTTTTHGDSGEHPRPLPPESTPPLDADRRGKPRTIREAIAENPLIIIAVVALLGAFALVGVRIVLPGLVSSEPPQESGSHWEPDSPSSQPRLPEDESAVIP